MNPDALSNYLFPKDLMEFVQELHLEEMIGFQ